MGKSRHTKWYDKNSDDYDDNRQQAEDYRERRARRLRSITEKHEELEGDDEE